jgi:hypothetical protein
MSPSSRAQRKDPQLVGSEHEYRPGTAGVGAAPPHVRPHHETRPLYRTLDPLLRFREVSLVADRRHSDEGSLLVPTRTGSRKPPRLATQV